MKMINLTTRVAAALVLVLALASCGNTIRGFGKDASNTVDATEDAAKNVAN
jgi:entericidin B